MLHNVTEHRLAMDACFQAAYGVSLGASPSENMQGLADYFVSVRNLIEYQWRCRSSCLSAINMATTDFQDDRMGIACMGAQDALDDARLLLHSYKVVNKTADRVKARVHVNEVMEAQLEQLFRESAAGCREALGFVKRSVDLMARSTVGFADESIAAFTCEPGFTPLGAAFFAPITEVYTPQVDELQAAREASLAEASSLTLARMEPDPVEEEEDDNPSSDHEV
jgi:hypothetical protein